MLAWREGWREDTFRYARMGRHTLLKGRTIKARGMHNNPWNFTGAVWVIPHCFVA